LRDRPLAAESALAGSVLDAKADHISARLILRRVRRLNPK